MIMKLPFEGVLPCGVCDFSAVKDKLIECRAKFRLPEGAQSVICYLFPYYLGRDAYENSNISKYAVSEDYHIIVGNYLEKAVNDLRSAYPQYNFQWFADNSPIPEVFAAALSGLGVEGKNGLLINEKYGSYCFIGEIVTDMKIPAASSEIRSCINCGKCVSACVGGALHETGFSRDKCISHLTQCKGEASQLTVDGIRETGCIWGCDRCQDACPMNENVSVTPLPEFIETARARYNFGDDIEKRAYSWRGKGVIERNFRILCCKDEENNL